MYCSSKKLPKISIFRFFPNKTAVSPKTRCSLSEGFSRIQATFVGSVESRLWFQNVARIFGVLAGNLETGKDENRESEFRESEIRESEI